MHDIMVSTSPAHTWHDTAFSSDYEYLMAHLLKREPDFFLLLSLNLLLSLHVNKQLEDGYLLAALLCIYLARSNTQSGGHFDWSLLSLALERYHSPSFLTIFRAARCLPLQCSVRLCISSVVVCGEGRFCGAFI